MDAHGGTPRPPEGAAKAGCPQAPAIFAPRDCNDGPTPHPDRRLLVFCVMLPWSPCSRMLFFSSSRWPLVVSRGTPGALPGPLWLWLSSGMGGAVFVIMVSVING